MRVLSEMHGCRAAGWLLAALMLTGLPGRAQSTPPQFNVGVEWGTVKVAALKEASGLAASWRSAQILWTHNDGDRRPLYAITPGGEHVATFTLPEAVGDLEEIAAGPGPVAGVPYLYAGDTGGQVGSAEKRDSVKVLRIVEPVAGAPPATGVAPVTKLSTADVFTLRYPDGSYDAEAMFVDPLTADLFLLTKTSPARLYRVNLNAVAPRTTVTLDLAGTVPFATPSAAAISRDGRDILVRNEDAAMVWSRPQGGTVMAALTAGGTSAPVIGTPLEPNGEAVTFLGNGNGYVTLSEEANPVLYHFQTRSPSAPVVHAPMPAAVVYEGSTLRLGAAVSGYPVPAFIWRKDGAVVSGQTGRVLNLTAAAASHTGTWQVTATNAHGSVQAEVQVTVRPRPDVRITEVQADPAGSSGADWWELTSFESLPVDLSGWRFNDDGGDLENAWIMPPGLVIEPGEVIVFVDDLTEAQFRSWWGSAVPPLTRVVTYGGSGLALGNSGDTLRLWDSTAVNAGDTLLTLTIGAATSGVTFTSHPGTGQFGSLSQAGVNGAQRSAGGMDTGSPGLWLPPPGAPQMEVSLSGGQVRFHYAAERLRWYTLESSPDMQAGNWSPEGPSVQAPASGAASMQVPVGGTQRFYRLRVR